MAYENRRKAKSKITGKFDFQKYVNFLLVNIPLVLLPVIVFVVVSKGTLVDGLFISIAALLIILLQYPVLVFVRYWILKIGVFYLSMFIFLFLYGFFITWNESAGGFPAGSWGARFSGAILLTFFGHFFGIIFFLVIALINWLLRKQLFVYAAENEV